MSDVYICNTVYHYLITLVKVLTGKRQSKLVLCTNDYLPQDVIERTKESGLFESIEIYKDLERFDPLLDYSAPFFKRGKSLKQQLDNFVDFNYCKDDEYYIFCDVSIIGKWLNAHKIKYNLIEDGLNLFRRQTAITNNYIEPQYKKIIRQFFNAGFYCFGQSKYTKTIEINSDKDLVVKLPKRKLKVVPRNELFAGLSEQDRKKIVDIFLDNHIKEDLLNSMKNIKGDVTLLITQPLADDEITTYETQGAFYKDIVEKYGSRELVIKPHPRDRYDYKKIFPEATIITWEYVPIELIGFFENINFSKALTWCSSSIDGVHYCQDKINLGLDYIKPYINIDYKNGFESKWSYAKDLIDNK